MLAPLFMLLAWLGWVPKAEWVGLFGLAGALVMVAAELGAEAVDRWWWGRVRAKAAKGGKR